MPKNISACAPQLNYVLVATYEVEHQRSEFNRDFKLPISNRVC